MTIENTELAANPEPQIEAPSADDAMGAAWDRMMVQNGADRGEDGKFTSAETAADPAKGVAPEAGAGDAESGPSTVTPAPAHLTGAIKSEWANIPEGARNEIARLTSDWDRKFGELGEQLGRVKPIAERLTRAVTDFPEFRGMSPDQIAEGALQLAAVQANLGKGPEAAVSTIMEVAKAYGVLPHLARAFQGQQQPDQQSSLITDLRQHVANLESRLQQAGNPDTIRETVSTALAERDTANLVQSYSADKPYWNDVEASLPAFIRAVMDQGVQRTPKETLELAYDMAINAIPTVREKVRAAEAKATAALPDPKRTEAARKAASINVRSSNSGKERPMTAEEAMASAYDRVMAN